MPIHHSIWKVGSTPAPLPPSKPERILGYLSFGDMSSRSWEDARRYGFISAGGGSWYSQTLKMLSPGDRVWVKIPKVGYVGVGIVSEEVQPAKDFTVEVDGEERPALEVLRHREQYQATAEDPEKSEYFVKVEWLDTLPREKAFHEIGLFGNQNSVCQPVAASWRHTVERLKTVFPSWDAKSRKTDCPEAKTAVSL